MTPDLPAGTLTLDVRPIIASGGEPFEKIMDGWSALASGGYLLVRAPFQARPLMAHFSAQGIGTRPHTATSDDHWLLIGPKP